ncbi:MAG: T9SS type A sorting domain-containing protein [Bacteroidia bacterium]|nr:T9SS type A sorting domain-containing protein [Bacteroidia bacterium]
MRYSLFTFFIVFAFSGFSQQNIYYLSSTDSVFSCNINQVYLDGSLMIEHDTAVVTPVVPSLISEDHTAEGFMVTLSTGAIVHFFRIDPGYWGNHTGNNARIVKRTTYNDGVTWGPIEEVFNDTNYDDRNVHGGLVGQDSIVLFWRRYNATYSQQIDLNYIYSLDGGQTWSQRTVINSISNGTPGSNKIQKIPGRGWLMSIAGAYYVEIRISSDGLTWNNNVAYVWNYSYNFQHYIHEPCFAYIGSGLIIGLMRNNGSAYGCTYFKVTSTDNGYTWSGPDSTNMATPFFCPSPLIFYDVNHKDIWSIATDRRNQCGAYLADSSSVWIYKNTVGEIFNNPNGFSLYSYYHRPQPSWYMFYGYSCSTRTSGGNELVVFTESHKKPNFLEDADLYQYSIQYMPMHYSSTHYIWNTGDTSEVTHADTSGVYFVTVSDDYGHSRKDSIFVSLIKNAIQDTSFTIQQGNNIILHSDTSLIGPLYTYNWSTGETTSSIEVSPQETTSYYITINNGFFNCSDSVTIHVNPVITAIKNNDVKDFNVQPNPFIQVTEIYFPNPGNERFRLMMYDLLGNLVRKQDNITGNHYTLNRDLLKDGIYMVEISSASASYHSDVIIGN